MGNVNAVPVVSQAKSIVLSVCGDSNGANKIQEQFIHECLVFSQVLSLKFYLVINL